MRAVTAADAHMRDYALWIPSDLVAGEDDDRAAAALDIMTQTMSAETRPASQLTFTAWMAELDQRSRADAA